MRWQQWWLFSCRLLWWCCIVARKRSASCRTGRRSPPAGVAGPPPAPPAKCSRSDLFRSPAFCTISVAFALGLAAQAGFLIHQVTYLRPLLGEQGAAFAVGLTAMAAVIGRLVMGVLVDRVDRRIAAGANFLVQATGLSLLIQQTSPKMLYASCAVFGFGVGNVNTLPGLIVQTEFPRTHFKRVVSLIVGINQFALALSPGLLGWLREHYGGYEIAFGVCVAAQVLAALVVMSGLRFRDR